MDVDGGLTPVIKKKKKKYITKTCEEEILDDNNIEKKTGISYLKLVFYKSDDESILYLF